jgi:hypothetical protein
MKELKSLFILLLLPTALAFSQKKNADFILPLPEKKIAHSLYNTLTLIDTRYDTSNIGVLWNGYVNDINVSPAPVTLAVQFKNLLDAATDGTALQGQLLIHIRFFKFTDVIDKAGHNGFCFFRAGFYAQAEHGYKKMRSVDTTLRFMIPSMGNNAKKLFRQCGEVISGIVTESLTMAAKNDSIYSFADIVNTDSLEKRKIPVYNTQTYKNGVYKNYTSFKNQEPDFTIAAIDTSNGAITSVRAISKNGKEFKVKDKEVYAVIFDSSICIATRYGYRPLTKIGDDFYLSGKMNATGYNTMDRKVAVTALKIPQLLSPLAPLHIISLSSYLAEKQTLHFQNF